jgi:uncharacterized protein involved in exopolysaccharide biosynthesis/Mrp family chromosome partitioning ATPase
MELSQFLKLLYRNKWPLILIPLITTVCVLFLVKDANVYRSRARLSTGIVDRSDALINIMNHIQESKINQDFSNLIEMIMMKKMISQVSYKLILHDMTDPKPFRKQSNALEELTEGEKNQALALFSEKYSRKAELMLSDEFQKKLTKVLKSMKYDEESIRKNLSVYRVNNSDFIDMQFESENPVLSAFILTTLSNEFITFYSENLNATKKESIAMLDSMMKQKQDTLRKKMHSLEAYKVKNGVLDINDQATTIIQQIAEFEAKRQEAQRNIYAYSGALSNINSKFDSKDRQYIESSLTLMNQDISTTRTRLNALNDEYIRSNFDPKYKQRIDSVQNVLTSQINRTNDSYTASPLSKKSDLVEQKLTYEVNLQMAKNSLASLSHEVNRLNGKLYSLVPDQATIKTLQDDIDIYTKEFIELSNKYNAANLEANFISKVRLVEPAEQGILQPSKKMLIVGFSGVIAFGICSMVLFIIFYIDRSIADAKSLANVAGQPVIGMLNQLPAYPVNIEKSWNQKTELPQWEEFKNQLRAIRFEIENDLKTAKIIGVTSFHEGEGKTFFAINLAYAYTMMNKRVLLIDGNFSSPSITEKMPEHHSLEDYLCSGPTELLYANPADKLVVLGNEGGDASILEVNTEAAIRHKLQLLKNEFDVIIIETPSLDTHNKAKEWIDFTDKISPVFTAGKSIKAAEKEMIEYLNAIGTKMCGWVLNKVKASSKKQSVRKGRIKKVKKVTA